MPPSLSGWLVVLAVQVAPVPPERIEPEQLPIPQTNTPLDQISTPSATPMPMPGPGTFRPARPADVPLRPDRRGTPSLMTDEAYRQARVRALLEMARRERAGL